MPPSLSDTLPAEPFTRTRFGAVWWALVATALGMVIWLASGTRGALRPGGSGDFATVYAATRAWIHGNDPYSAQQLDREWVLARGSAAVAPTAERTPSVYPPGTMLLVAPIAGGLSWPAARAVWTFTSFTLAIAMFAVLPGLAGLRWSDPWAVVLVMFAIALEPIRSGLSLGQPVIAATALVVLGATMARWNRDSTAGVLLALALTVKPQIAGPFIAYYLLHQRWLLSGIAGFGVILINCAAAFRLWIAGIPWLTELLRNLRTSTAPGGINDPTLHGAHRFALVNLQVLLHVFIESRSIVSGLTLITTATCAVLFAVIVLRNQKLPPLQEIALPARDLAELAFVASCTLLPIYHRWYDAAILVMVLPWAAAAVAARRWIGLALVTIALMTPFLINIAVRLAPEQHAVARRHPPLLEYLVLPVQCWAALLLSGLFLFILWRPAADQIAFEPMRVPHEI